MPGRTRATRATCPMNQTMTDNWPAGVSFWQDRDGYATKHGLFLPSDLRPKT